MIDSKTIPSLYDITGDIKDIHMMVVPKRLLDRLEAAEKDAARYRWMREQYGFTLERIVDRCVTASHVDAEIDSAMGEGKS